MGSGEVDKAQQTGPSRKRSGRCIIAVSVNRSAFIGTNLKADAYLLLNDRSGLFATTVNQLPVGGSVRLNSIPKQERGRFRKRKK